MRFVLLVWDKIDGKVKIAKRGRYADCVAAQAVLGWRHTELHLGWAVTVNEKLGYVTEEECPGITAAAGPRKTLRQKFADLDELSEGPFPATPENAGTRYPRGWDSVRTPGDN